MAQVTVPGVGGTHEVVEVGSGLALNIAQQIADALAAAAPVNVVLYAGDPIPPPTNATDELLVKGVGGESVNVPDGYEYIVNNSSALVSITAADTAILSNTVGGSFTVSGLSTVTAAGDNVIVGQPAGKYLLVGGDGNDQIYNLGGGTIAGGGGSNFLTTRDPDNTQATWIISSGVNDTIVAGAGADTISSSGNNPLIWGGSGDLVVGIDSGVGATIVGGTGSETIFAGQNNIVWGGSGKMVVLATDEDTVVGGSGNDTIYGGGGATLAGGGGSNLLWATAGSNLIYANGTGDVVVTGAGTDTVAAFGSNTMIWGGSGNLLVGGGDATTISAGTGSETIFGGNDNVVSGNHSSGILFAGGAGSNATVWGSADSITTIFGSAGSNVEFADGGPSGGLLWAGAGNETLQAAASSANNTLIGGAGSASLVGGSGSDVFWAGAGANTLTGGASSDAFNFVHGQAGGNDVITDFSSEDMVNLLGYGSDAASNALASATVAGGSTTIQLSDSTRVTFLNVTNLNPNNFYSG